MTTTVTRTTTDHPWLVFDVESAGLHGQGFAVGWIVVKHGVRRALEEGIAVADYSDGFVHGGERLPTWVLENVAPALPPRTYNSPEDVRNRFWGAWIDWKRRGALLAADVAWPVEARFLAACVDDHRTEREFDGPYPLIDIASVRLAVGLDPLAEVERLPNELPAHNPLNDARQGARLLMEALER